MIKATRSPLPLFGPLILDYAVAGWAFEGGFFVEAGLLDGSYSDVLFLLPVYDVVYICFRPLQFS